MSGLTNPNAILKPLRKGQVDIFNLQADMDAEKKKTTMHKCCVCQTPTTKKCGRCHLRYYCTRQCQAQDKDNHATSCVVASAPTPAPVASEPAKLPPDLTCAICMSVPVDPVSCSNEHVFCKSEIRRALRHATKPECPTCKVPMDEHKLNRSRLAFQTLDFMIPSGFACPHKGALCSWTGAYRDVLSHLEKNCPAAVRECSDCLETLSVETVKTHADSCLERIVEHKECERKMPRRYLDDHKNACIYVMVECPCCCLPFSRNNLLGHVVVCPKEKLDCPFKDELHCDVSPCRDELCEHMQSDEAHVRVFRTVLRCLNSDEFMRSIQNAGHRRHKPRAGPRHEGISLLNHLWPSFLSAIIDQ